MANNTTGHCVAHNGDSSHGDQPINQSRSEKATVDTEPNDRGCNATWPTSSRVREERSWLEGFWLPGGARLRLRRPRLRPTRPRPTSCEGQMSVTRRPARPAPKHRPAPEHGFLHRELEAAIPVRNTYGPCYKLLTQRERETD